MHTKMKSGVTAWGSHTRVVECVVAMALLLPEDDEGLDLGVWQGLSQVDGSVSLAKSGEAAGAPKPPTKRLRGHKNKGKAKAAKKCQVQRAEAKDKSEPCAALGPKPKPYAESTKDYLEAVSSFVGK